MYSTFGAGVRAGPDCSDYKISLGKVMRPLDWQDDRRNLYVQLVQVDQDAIRPKLSVENLTFVVQMDLAGTCGFCS